MTNIDYMEISSGNTQSGSYEVAGNSNREDAFLIGDKVETGLFPANTLDSGVSVSFPAT